MHSLSILLLLPLLASASPGGRLSHPLNYEARQRAKQARAESASTAQTAQAFHLRQTLAANPSAPGILHLSDRHIPLHPHENAQLQHAEANLADKRAAQYDAKARRYAFKAAGGDVKSDEGLAHAVTVSDARESELGAKRGVMNVKQGVMGSLRAGGMQGARERMRLLGGGRFGSPGVTGLRMGMSGMPGPIVHHHGGRSGMGMLRMDLGTGMNTGFGGMGGRMGGSMGMGGAGIGGGAGGISD